jgi:hypothetical protein
MLGLQCGQLASQPFGGLPIAAEIARSLAPLETVPQRKIDSPARAAFGANKTLALERLPFGRRKLQLGQRADAAAGRRRTIAALCVCRPRRALSGAAIADRGRSRPGRVF